MSETGRLVPRTTRERKLRRHSQRIPTVLYVDPEYGLVRDRQDMPGNDLTTVMRWCSTHDEVVWLYNDGSYTCPHEMVIEYDDGTHVLTDPPFTVTRCEASQVSRSKYSPVSAADATHRCRYDQEPS